MIRRVSNILNVRKNEIVAKKRREKLKFNAHYYKIKTKIAKTKITRFNLNNCDCHVL